MNFISQYIDLELAYLIAVCCLILLVVVGGYVFMFLLVMKNDPRENEFRKDHGWDNSLIPHQYEDEIDK